MGEGDNLITTQKEEITVGGSLNIRLKSIRSDIMKFLWCYTSSVRL